MQKWIERAKDTARFHRAKRVLDEKWDITKTAQALRRSRGSICEDLKIASWLKTHTPQIEKFEFAYEALEFIRKKEKEIDLADLDA